MAPTATVPSLTPQTAHAPQDNRCCIDRIAKPPGNLRNTWLGLFGGIELFNPKENECMPPDRQYEETRCTHGANEDYVSR